MSSNLLYAVVAKMTDDSGKALVLEGQSFVDDFGDEIFSLHFKDLPENTIFNCIVQPTFAGNEYVVDKKSIKVLEEEEETGVQGWQELNGIWFSPEEMDIFDAVERMLLDDLIVNMRYIGASGLGKTSRARAWAESVGLETCTVDCGGIRSSADWFMTREIIQGETVDKFTDFAVQLPLGNRLFLFDEFNRVPAGLHNSLMGLLDYRRTAQFMHNMFTVGPSSVFLLTENVGFQFVGTHTVDLAIKKRVPITLVAKYPPKDVEYEIIRARWDVDAEIILDYLIAMRDDPVASEAEDLTTRVALNLAQLVFYGIPIGQAFKSVLINSEEEQVQKAMNDILKGIK